MIRRSPSRTLEYSDFIGFSKRYLCTNNWFPLFEVVTETLMGTFVREADSNRIILISCVENMNNERSGTKKYRYN